MKQSIYLILMISVVFCSTNTIKAKMPSNSFACHVVTQSNDMGITFIQADDVAEAEKASLGKKAYITADERDTATTVLQCVDYPEGKLTDSEAQKLMESIPQ